CFGAERCCQETDQYRERNGNQNSAHQFLQIPEITSGLTILRSTSRLFKPDSTDNLRANCGTCPPEAQAMSVIIFVRCCPRGCLNDCWPDVIHTVRTSTSGSAARAIRRALALFLQRTRHASVDNLSRPSPALVRGFRCDHTHRSATRRGGRS